MGCVCLDLVSDWAGCIPKSFPFGTFGMCLARVLPSPMRGFSMLTAEQRRRTLSGIYACLEALRDNSPVTEEERSRHYRLVQREVSRNETKGRDNG